MGSKTEILEGGGDREEGEEGEEGEGEISPMCESIGHGPLRGRCPKRTDRHDRHAKPKTDRQTDREAKNGIQKIGLVGLSMRRSVGLSRLS